MAEAFLSSGKPRRYCELSANLPQLSLLKWSACILYHLRNRNNLTITEKDGSNLDTGLNELIHIQLEN